ncbi:MAG: 30S ribosomal protein S6--L-glutamate ligase [Cyanobacteria bacterium P01_D01_bin.105]
MKIAVLSRDASLYSTRRLLAAGEAQGHTMSVVSPLRCYMDITARDPQILYQGRPLPRQDAIIPRIGHSQTHYGAAVVRQFEQMGTFVVNSAEAIVRSRNKLECLQVLSKRGIALPRTGFAHANKDIDSLIELVGGAPLVIKVLEGAHGVGVVLADTHESARSIIEAFYGLKARILVQEFVEEASGEDIRCLVVHGEVIAAMKRKGAPGEFRANLHRGGGSQSTTLSPSERQIAIKAAAAVGLQVAGVDILRSNHGPLVIEINSSPGLEGIETATDVDVAERIIAFVTTAA